MIDKLMTLWPEIVLFATTCAVMIAGLSPSRQVRRWCPHLCAAGLFAAGVLALTTTPELSTALPFVAAYTKAMITAVGLLMLMLLVGVAYRGMDLMHEGRFDPMRSNRAEFYSFFLFSLTGLMLCAGAEDLIWLFLALELTSLPTYVMVAIATGRGRSLEAAVKYFFLGALGAAIFLYGFVLIYGGTGFVYFDQIRAVVDQQIADDGAINALTLAGVVLAIVGLCFKIAAVPMHFYTADVYQGATAPVAAMLAFVPKTAGFLGIIMIASLPGWAFGADGQSLPAPVHTVLWIIAALTMTVGNALALVQSSVKRILAYSSIAHSGYMLVGVIAGPGLDGGFTRNGIAAVLFYLLVYGVINLGAFAVVASLERRAEDGEPEEIDSFADLRGLCRIHPVSGWTMVLCSIALLGLPPLLGFIAKLPLFTSGIAAGEVPLVIILGINSAIAAFYYLRLAATPLLEDPEPRAQIEPATPSPFTSRRVAGAISAASVVALVVVGAPLGDAADRAATHEPNPRSHRTEAMAADVRAADADVAAVQAADD